MNCPRKSPVAEAAWREVADLLRAKQWNVAVARLRSLADETRCCEVRITLGALLAERECYFEAIQWWTTVLEDAGREGHREYLSAAFHNLAVVYRELGDHDLARRFQQRSLQLMDDCGSEELLGLANDALATGCGRGAEALLESASGLAAEDDSIQIDLTASAGVTCSMRGKPSIAVRLLRVAYRQHLANGNERDAGRDLLNLAATLRQAGRLQLERKCLNRAAKHFDRAHMPLSRARSIERRRQVEQLIALQFIDPRVN